MSFEAKQGDIIGAYQVKKHLNNGGMAYVVLASSRKKEYALKVTRVSRSAEQSEQNTSSTKKEVDCLQKLSHERIVKVFQLKVNEENVRMKGKKIFYASAQKMPGAPWYFAMEYLAGGTLDQYVRQCGPLTIAEATNITVNISLALEYLHNKGITHNDVKPENVMFRKRIQQNQPFDPVLIDFGTAAGVNKFRDESGTWYIMAPERIRGAKGIDPPEKASLINPVKSDVWSLGILLYQALTNALPFPSSNQRRLTSQILNDTPKAISQRNPLVPVDLDEFIIRDCLAKEPKDRPTVLEFLKFISKYSERGVPATSIKDNYYGKE